MDILMPQLGETVTEGTVATWHKQEGDEVAKDEVLLDVETDKAATEIPAPIAGVITSVLVQEGETVDVGTVLGVIDGPDTVTEDKSAGDEEKDIKPSSTTQTSATKDSSAERTSPTQVTRIERKLRLSPVVRRLLAEHQLDPQEISGSGRDGRITRNDVLVFVEGQTADKSVRPSEEATIESITPHVGAKPVTTLASSKSTTDVLPPAQQFNDGDRVPFDRIRRVTAEHMVRSKATSPHVLQAVETNFSAVDSVRCRFREAWIADYGFSLTYMPFICRATCMALRDFPRLNGRVDGDGLVLNKRVHLSVAVDLNFQGLVAPVIRDAEGLTVSGLAHRIHEISGRAREGVLKSDELKDGTYTISNNGSFGTLLTAPIINQPQVGILSVDAITKRPVVVEGPTGDSIAIRLVGILSQSFDHRAIDGSYSAAFLHKIRTLLEEKDWSGEF
jgi:2-oxoglutarate dehydrogenase E2 component (dihydrolipoamide succinyltransferase)